MKTSMKDFHRFSRSKYFYLMTSIANDLPDLNLEEVSDFVEVSY